MMSRGSWRLHGLLSIACVIFMSFFLLSGCISDDDDDDDIMPPDNSAEDLLMDSTFRIDISQIDVIFDYFPESQILECDAEVAFTMRSGQTIPLIHYDPAVRNQPPTSIFLDGEELDFNNPDDVKIVLFEGSTQKAIEFQRTISDSATHTLRMLYTRTLPYQYPAFVTDVSDIEGIGNEEIFPTLNVPQELARHRLTFRVHSDIDYICIGSGYVTESSQSSGIQEWVLDTEREIASYTIMFLVVPSADFVYAERTINGVPVRILSFIDDANPQDAFAYLETWLPELEDNFGTFPMPRGLSIYLTLSGGGMEYFGGTMTSLWALNHEVFHMYFACSTVAKTYRDSWWDEAIDMWYELSLRPNFEPISPNYRSNIVGGRSAIEVGFDTRAYDEGAQIIEAVAQRLGSRDRMIEFLSDVHGHYSFAPFNTWDFLYYLKLFGGPDMDAEFDQWLYSDEGQQAPRSTNRHVRERFRFSPPPGIVARYSR